MQEHRVRSGWWVPLFVVISVTLAGAIPSWCGAEEPSARRSQRTDKTQTPNTERSLERRLDELLANQATLLANQTEILQRFDAVMEELRIIKVRATSRGS